MSSPDAVCFDLDGTLCVSEQDPGTLLETAFLTADADPSFGVGDLAAVDVGALPTAETDLEFYEAYFRAGARRAGADPSDPALSVVATAYLEQLDPAAVRPREGAVQAVEAAREAGPVALVTNGGEAIQRRKLDAIGLADAFDAVVCCDPANGIDPKPNPTPLELALDQLAVQPEDAVLVGDSLSCDVRGARAAGMSSAWVPTTEPDPQPDPEPTHVFQSLLELQTLL